MLEHIDRAIERDGHATRELFRIFLVSMERKLDKMAISTKDVLALLQSQETQIDGIVALCDTLNTHLKAVIAKLDAGTSDNAQVQADLQAMSDMLNRQSGKIAKAITDEADVPDSVPPAEGTGDVNPATGSDVNQGSVDQSGQSQPDTGNPTQPGSTNPTDPSGQVQPDGNQNQGQLDGSNAGGGQNDVG